jgi:hypothetical protein
MRGSNAERCAPIISLSGVLGENNEAAGNQENEEPDNEAAGRVIVPVVPCNNKIVHFSYYRSVAVEGSY